MAPVGNLFDETLDAWGYTRDGVIGEFRNIPEEQFSYRPSGQSRTVAELAQHIIESGLLAAGELARRDGNFQRQDYQAFILEYAGRRAHTADRHALIELLESTHSENIAALRGAGEAALLQPIIQFNGVRAGTRPSKRA